MHGISAHSALAIKRQRRRRDGPRRGKGRRSSVQQDHYEGNNTVMGTITMFHVGAVFLLLAAFLMLGAVLTSESRRETVELVGTGIICLIIGLFLVILNRFYGQKEEDDLANYVETRLGRSRSGQRLYHESDSMPEQLGGAAGPSNSVSMESDISQDMSSKTKGNKRGKKNKQRGIEDTTTAVNGGQSPKVKDMVNEHNQLRNSSSPYHHNDVSSANVTLDRIAEEGRIVGVGMEHQQISYVNANYDDISSSRGASNNLYRVYDRDSYSRGGGV